MRSAVLAPASLNRRRSLDQFRGQVTRLFVYLITTTLAYWLWWNFVARQSIPPVLLSYGAVFILLLLSECFSSLAAITAAPAGALFPSLHNRPLLALSVADFWGARWNLWFSDWFRYAVFGRMRRRPAIAVIVVFGMSGGMHEWAVNLPLFLATGRSLFGTMMIYFVLQGAGVLFERRWLWEGSWAKRIFAWFIVFGVRRH